METTIKKIEDMSLNAWPSHKMELYDGWILRFSYFYTHRTNSVEQFGTSTLPWREKIPYCEQVYKRLGTPAIFKISPLVSPDFDYMLENRGYSVQHITNVMTVDLDNAVLDAPVTDVLFSNEIPDFWIHSLFDLKRTTNRRRGYARQICTGLLNEGKKRGASHAYLQVVKNNTSAEELYSSLGFQYSYTYWFRVQPVGTRFQ